eukprot:764357-Amphidinium_carterae.1
MTRPHPGQTWIPPRLVTASARTEGRNRGKVLEVDFSEDKESHHRTHPPNPPEMPKSACQKRASSRVHDANVDTPTVFDVGCPGLGAHAGGTKSTAPRVRTTPTPVERV